MPRRKEDCEKNRVPYPFRFGWGGMESKLSPKIGFLSLGLVECLLKATQ